MKDFYTRIVGHWQMTAIGLGAAACSALGEYLLSGQVTWKGALVAVFCAVGGALKKNLQSWVQPQ